MSLASYRNVQLLDYFSDLSMYIESESVRGSIIGHTVLYGLIDATRTRPKIAKKDVKSKEIQVVYDAFRQLDVENINISELKKQNAQSIQTPVSPGFWRLLPRIQQSLRSEPALFYDRVTKAGQRLENLVNENGVYNAPSARHNADYQSIERAFKV